MAKKGHNSDAESLRAYIERIERVNEEVKSLGDDRREIFAEAKGNGFDTAAMRRALAQRKLEADEREERRRLDEQYADYLDLV